jgi:hypothetical protein
VLNDSPSTNLLCNPDLVPFYERAGLECKGDFVTPTAQQGFEFSRDMCRDLKVMGSPGSGKSAPVFILNEDDAKQLLAIGAAPKSSRPNSPSKQILAKELVCRDATLH